MELSDTRLASGAPGNVKLETAFIYLLDQFRKIYVTDQILKTSKVYERLEKNLGLQDEASVLTVYVRKMWAVLFHFGVEIQLWVTPGIFFWKVSHVLKFFMNTVIVFENAIA